MTRGWIPCVAWAAVVVGLVRLDAQTIAVTQIGRIPDAVDSVEIATGHAFTASAKVLTSYDLAAPQSPQKRGTHTFPEEIWSFRIDGSFIYAGVNFYGLGILDISSPGAPRLRGAFKTPGQAKVGAIFGTRAVVIDHMEGVVDVDVSNPATPVSKGSFFLDGYARDVVSKGAMAYAVDSPAGLYVFDLARSGPLEPVAAVQSGTALRMLEVTDLPDGRRVAVLVGGGALQLYDVTTGRTPTALAVLKTPGGAQRVTLQGTHAYVADAQAGLQIVDIAKPESPRIVGTYATRTAARDAAVSGDLVLVATTEEVVVLRVGPGAR